MEENSNMKELFPNLTVYTLDDYDEEDVKHNFKGAEFCFAWMVKEQCISKEKVKKAEHWLRNLPEYALNGYRKELGL